MCVLMFEGHLSRLFCRKDGDEDDDTPPPPKRP